MQRHQHGIGGDQAVEGEQAERRRAVDQHVVEPGGGAADGVAQQGLATLEIDQFELGGRQVHGRRDHGKAGHRGLDQGVLERHLTEQQIVGADCAARAFDAEAGRRVALGIEIDHQHPAADRGQSGGEVDRRGRLADAAFLVGDGDDAAAGIGVRPRRGIRSTRWIRQVGCGGGVGSKVWSSVDHDTKSPVAKGATARGLSGV